MFKIFTIFSMIVFLIFPLGVGAFELFDGTKYSGKPASLAATGFKPIKIIYESEIWPGISNSPTLPSESLVQDIASRIPKGSYVVLDVEHWPLEGCGETAINNNLIKYRLLIQWFRKYAANVKFGYYGVIPITDYWRASGLKGTIRSAEWKKSNEFINAIVDDLDVLFPVAYTFYDDRTGWVKYANAQVTEARRLSKGKPVFVFLWPQYHDSNAIKGGQFLPASYWKLQLDTISKIADGAVIWGGWASNVSTTSPLIWDSRAPWWTVTKNFLNKIVPAVSAPISRLR